MAFHKVADLDSLLPAEFEIAVQRPCVWTVVSAEKCQPLFVLGESDCDQQLQDASHENLFGEKS